MTYAIAKIAKAQLETSANVASAALSAIPGVGTGLMGLTPDSVRATAEWQNARRSYERAWSALRAFNGRFVKTYAEEIRAERDARQAA